MRRAACARNASMMAGCPWPRQFTAHPWTKSRYARPVSSRSQEPLPSIICTDGRFGICMTCAVDGGVVVIMPTIVTGGRGGGKSELVILTISAGGGSPRSSLDRVRVDRRADRAHHGQRRRDEQERVLSIRRAIRGQLLEVEDLAEREP